MNDNIIQRIKYNNGTAGVLKFDGKHNKNRNGLGWVTLRWNSDARFTAVNTGKARIL